MYSISFSSACKALMPPSSSVVGNFTVDNPKSREFCQRWKCNNFRVVSPPDGYVHAVVMSLKLVWIYKKQTIKTMLLYTCIIPTSDIYKRLWIAKSTFNWSINVPIWNAVLAPLAKLAGWRFWPNPIMHKLHDLHLAALIWLWPPHWIPNDTRCWCRCPRQQGQLPLAAGQINVPANGVHVEFQYARGSLQVRLSLRQGDDMGRKVTVLKGKTIRLQRVKVSKSNHWWIPA